MDFTPAHTTATGVLPISERSALMSIAVVHKRDTLQFSTSVTVTIRAGGYIRQVEYCSLKLTIVNRQQNCG